MRQTKFRVWDKNRKKMYYHWEILMIRNRNKKTPVYIIDGEIICSDDYVLLEYIGRKDMNGKEIWEGDICRNGDWVEDAHSYLYRLDVVQWNDISACWIGWDYSGHGPTSCEVIGNVYENPEILENN